MAFVFKGNKLIVNYYLGLSINNPVIIEKVKEVQDLALKTTNELKPALINLSKLHITFAVTRLEEESDVNIVNEKLCDWAKARASELSETPILLNFVGINYFKGNVLYADLERSESYGRLGAIALELNDLLKSAGYLVDNKEFKPHLTILKLSKAPRLLKNKKKFNRIFETLKTEEFVFGVQKFDNLKLLSMHLPQQKVYCYPLGPCTPVLESTTGTAEENLDRNNLTSD